MKEYGLESKNILRPFYPGGDYESENYTPDTVVIDNPPFSILTKIVKYYIQNGVKFFLFAPQNSLFCTAATEDVTYIVTGANITYENGAVVNTSFITNMDKARIRTAPELLKTVNSAVKQKPKILEYEYPDHVITSSIVKCVKSLNFEIAPEQCHFVRRLKHQKQAKKAIFGGGFLINDPKAKELKAKELKCERERYVWELSEEEKEIIQKLNQ